ncbi:PAS domain-containing protein [Chachezhania antarctica]|uniref:PAS domain-containing protein n=1 Tax=Chachezhania antarctica TaxID=2340860 RepID=UPI000EB2EAAC|nr:PAS domain-containing protein [Chachezhania antarctica]|tara:strand:- start:4236 stop:5186 length:951 start_codon:yes stop_codon:yes gene_type:complete
MFDVVHHARLPLCITDPHSPDNPIVFVNPAFCALTGYSAEEVIGANCRFLQGAETTPESVAEVRALVENRAVDTVEIVNYRKDGTPFINALQIGPIFDADGNLRFFFGSQLDITQKRTVEDSARRLADDEILHRLKNIVNVMTVITKLSARHHSSVTEFGDMLTARLAALSEVHFSNALRPGDDMMLSNLLGSIVSAYAAIDERQFAVKGPDVVVPPNLVSPMSIVLHELSTNAVKYGALGAESGRVDVDWTVEGAGPGEQLRLTWTERGGPSIAAPTRTGGTGIIRNILKATGGQLEFEWAPEGLVSTLLVPLRA